MLQCALCRFVLGLEILGSGFKARALRLGFGAEALGCHMASGTVKQQLPLEDCSKLLVLLGIGVGMCISSFVVQLTPIHTVSHKGSYVAPSLGLGYPASCE